MQFQRYFTRAGSDPLAGIKFVKRTSEIRNPDGTEVYKADAVEVPESWSQMATADPARELIVFKSCIVQTLMVSDCLRC